MRMLIYVAIFAAAVTTTGAVWWSTGNSGTEQAGETAREGEACTSCAARHQRLTKSNDESGAQ